MGVYEYESRSLVGNLCMACDSGFALKQFSMLNAAHHMSGACGLRPICRMEVSEEIIVFVTLGVHDASILRR
jgi:hypothetical protein